jgi:hypothetical protein
MSAVTDDPAWNIRQAIEQTGCERQFMRLARCESKGDGPPTPVGDHASPCAIAAARSTKRFASISPSAMPPFF